MLHLAASEVKQRLGQCMESALTEPIVIEKSGRPAAVMLSIAEYERLQAMDDAYWGERAKQALEGGLAGTDETMGRLQERTMLRLNLTNAALGFLDDLPGKQLKLILVGTWLSMRCKARICRY